MYKVVTPKSDTEFEAYFHFRWAHLRQPWNFPPGSEKDEYEQVAEHPGQISRCSVAPDIAIMPSVVGLSARLFVRTV